MDPVLLPLKWPLFWRLVLGRNALDSGLGSQNVREFLSPCPFGVWMGLELGSWDWPSAVFPTFYSESFWLCHTASKILQKWSLIHLIGIWNMMGARLQRSCCLSRLGFVGRQQSVVSFGVRQTLVCVCYYSSLVVWPCANEKPVSAQCQILLRNNAGINSWWWEFGVNSP